MDIRSNEVGQSRLNKVYSTIRSWQFVYLVFFGAGLILPNAWTDTEKYQSLWISLAFTVVAFLVKLISLICKNKPSLREFIKMQWSFIVPYAMLVINLVLGIYFIQVFVRSSWFSQFDTKLVAIINNTRLGLSTIICSLIMDSRVRKFQFYGIFSLIVLLMASQLKANINIIQVFNTLSDSLAEGQQQNVFLFITGQVGPQQFNQTFDQLSQMQSTIENGKDYGLASTASLIAQFLIMIDVISRPQQKVQQREQLYQEFATRFEQLKTNRQIQMTLLTHQVQFKQQTK